VAFLIGVPPTELTTVPSTLPGLGWAFAEMRIMLKKKTKIFIRVSLNPLTPGLGFIVTQFFKLGFDDALDAD
jgi:hypothetical protein